MYMYTKLQACMFEELSPPLLQVSTQPEIADDPCKDVKYKEATVDSMRAQKDEVRSLFILLLLLRTHAQG